MQDFVTSSSEVADCNLLSTPHLLLPTVAPKTVQKERVLLKASVGFVHFELL